MSYTYKYPRPSFTADCLVFAGNRENAHLLLIQRKNWPFEGMWALPGGFMDMDETIEETAARELEEETGLSGLRLFQFRVYSAIDRDPRGRTVTLAFYGYAGGQIPRVKGNTDAVNAVWHTIGGLPPLGFDHGKIIEDFIRSPLFEKIFNMKKRES